MAEAQALKNLRLPERRQYEKDKAELNQLRNARREQEEQEREEEVEQQRWEEQARLRRERQQARAQRPAAAPPEPDPTPDGFELATPMPTDLTPLTRHNQEW